MLPHLAGSRVSTLREMINVVMELEEAKKRVETVREGKRKAT